METRVLARFRRSRRGQKHLATALENRLLAPIVQYGQFQTLTRMSVQDVQDWFVGRSPNEFALVELLQELTWRTRWDEPRTPVRLLFSNRRLGGSIVTRAAFIDFLVWVHTPLDLALCRALKSVFDAFAYIGRCSGIGGGRLSPATPHYPIIRECMWPNALG